MHCSYISVTLNVSPGHPTLHPGPSRSTCCRPSTSTRSLSPSPRPPDPRYPTDPVHDAKLCDPLHLFHVTEYTRSCYWCGFLQSWSWPRLLRSLSRACRACRRSFSSSVFRRFQLYCSTSFRISSLKLTMAAGRLARPLFGACHRPFVRAGISMNYSIGSSLPACSQSTQQNPWNYQEL